MAAAELEAARVWVGLQETNGTGERGRLGDAKAEMGSDWWRKEGARMLNGKRMP